MPGFPTTERPRGRFAFRAALTSGFVEICMIDVKNVPGFRKKRAKPLGSRSSHLRVCISRIPYEGEGGGCALFCAK